MTGQVVTLQRAMQIGLEHHRGGRLAEAERIYQSVLQADPNNSGALHLLGVIAYQVGRYDMALDLIGRALLREPSNPNFLNDRGAVLQQLKRHEEALAAFDKALASKPDYADALANRGNALKALARYQEALASYDRAVAINSSNGQVHYNRGNILMELGRREEALAAYDRALAINPGHAEAHSNAGLCRLLLGDFARGWAEYEWRSKCSDYPFLKREFSRPLWLGQEDISGATVLLHAEQGLGDTIQFSRYVEAVARRGARVILEVQPTLKPLLSDIAGAHLVVGQGEPLPEFAEFDFHCPLLSLPLAFETRLETIPATIPYLRAPAAAIDKWARRLGPKATPRVGIVWSGHPDHRNDRNRSMGLDKLVALSRLGVTLVSLQKEVRDSDAKVLAANGQQILHFGSELADFSDTAALVSLMDLVISVDTSVAHLAGALGAPLWILLPFAPDWRWLVDRADSPWYPNARLFRQPRIGDWDGVIETVMHDLSMFWHALPRVSG